MNVVTLPIKRGITLYYIQTDKFTSNYFSVHFLSPLESETAASHSLLAKVLKKGCRLYPSQEQIAKRSEELYATAIGAGVTKIGETQSFFLSCYTLDDRFVFDGETVSEDAFSLLSSVLKDPLLVDGVFDNDIVEREKHALCDRIRSQINNKNAYAVKRCREIMCENERYRFSLDGTEEDVGRINSAWLYDAYLNVLDKAPVCMFYIGNEVKEVVLSRAQALCMDLKEREVYKQSTECIRQASTIKRACETVGALQGKLVMGFRTACLGGEAGAPALSLFDTVFGSSPISKLFMNVREKLGICYYCSSKCDLNKGVMFVSCGVDNKNAELAEREIMAQLKETALGNITDKELFYAKETIRDSLLSLEDSPSTLEGWYLNYCLRQEMLSPEQVWKKIECLTAEDVKQAAAAITPDTVYFLKGSAEGASEEDDEA